MLQRFFIMTGQTGLYNKNNMIKAHIPILDWINAALLFICIGAISFKSTSYNPPAAQNISTRPFTTGFRPNQQRDCIVGYSVIITTSASLLAGVTGQVILQHSSDSTTWTTIMSAQQGFSSGVAIPASTGSITVFGLVKAGHWCRVITNNIAGAPSYSTPTGTELSF